MKLYWMQAGGCSGDTMSLLSLEANLFAFFEQFGIEVLWHPSLSNLSAAEHRELLGKIEREEIELDIFVLEGNVVLGPKKSGMFDTFLGKPKKDWIKMLASKARYVIAAGTCASFGGFGCGDEMDGVGLQFKKERKGGFLGKDFRSKSGYEVINLPGCPIHPKGMEVLLSQIALGLEIELMKQHQPETFYNFSVHQGCSRNEYHEYRIEENVFGEPGCMFFHLGCKGPTTYNPCNKYLWNGGTNSKTRAGVPCFGCTRPDFPQASPFFKTSSIFDTPKELPKGVDRAHYLAYKDLAWAAAPARLKKRIQRV